MRECSVALLVVSKEGSHAALSEEMLTTWVGETRFAANASNYVTALEELVTAIQAVGPVAFITAFKAAA